MPESKLTLGRVDVPASRSADDALDRGALVTRLTELLVEGDGAKRRASRLVVGLSGAWGSGKSSIMGQVAEKLASMSNVLVVQFNPWVFADQSNLIQAFFDEMRAQIGRSNNEKAKDLLTSLDNYRDPIIYDKEETRQLIVREVPRYRRFIKDGRWLSTPSESDTFFAVLQTDNWHKDLREVVEETLLDDDLAVAILASLMTPPGYGLERGVLEKFVSEVLVLGRLEEIKTVSDEYLDRCMVNLSKALRQPSGGDF